ncbi:eCIS core domain-containing protein [Motiliproteus sp.]|uniref:eCIS core domain-containing protein n=1 Tax=Motiliproteus sp. TaxID=1898955 RepID=UPI003BAC9A65
MQPSKLPRSATRVRSDQSATLLRAAAVKDGDKVQPGLVRAALKSTRVSSPNDPAEKEADRNADNVMRMQLPDSRITAVPQGAGQVFRYRSQSDSLMHQSDGEQEEELQRQTDSEQEEELQHQADGEQEEELQRQADTEQEESLQRRVDNEHQSSLQRQAEEEEEESLQRSSTMEAQTADARVAAKAEGGVNLSANLQAEINSATGAGEPLPLSVRRFMEPRFNADFSAIRIHRDSQSARLNKRLSAKAFAYRNHLFFGDNQYQPDSDTGKRLIAHELTHSIQQGAAPRQSRAAQTATASKASISGDRSQSSFGSSIQSSPPNSQPSSDASPPLQRTVEVTLRSQPRVQRLGIGDALDYFADKAHHIPGFRMFTLLLGINPINRSRVEHSAANLLRALVEFLPGGHLITQALDNHGVFTRVAGWVNERLASLAITGGAIRNAVMNFLNPLGWRDIFDLGGVWQRAKRIFTEPIGRIIRFVRGLMSGILGFIKQAILMPLAQLASRTRGWDLLCAVLGRNPVTGQPVERNAENLIGGFMRLIGQQEVWENIKRANAIPRAWAWFQGALAGLLGFVGRIPQLVINALNALGVAELLNLPGIFVRIARSFAGFVLRFIRWAGQQVIGLLRIIFEVVAPGLMPFLRRARGAFGTIIRDPVGFIRNLVRAGILGFRRFSENFLGHLRTSLLNWLTGTLAGTGVYLPQSFSLRELIKFVLSVLGLTWQNIRRKLVKAVGETAVAAMERGFSLVKTLITEGPAALWQKIRASLTNLRQLVLERIMNFVAVRIVQAAVIRLVSMLNPVGAFVQAILAIYNSIMFFVERLRTLVQVARSVINSIVAIAAGRIRPAAARVERAMAGALTLVISFLARLMGLGNASRVIGSIIDRIRQPIDRALNRAVGWIVTQARRLGRFVAQAGVPRDPQQRLRRGLDAAKRVVTRLPRNELGEALIRRALALIKTRYGFEVLEPRVRNNRWWVYGRINPEAEADTGMATNDASPEQAAAALPDQIDILDNSNTVQIQNYSRSRRSGAVMQSLYSGRHITLNQVRFIQNGNQTTQSLGSGQPVNYSIAAANGDYAPPPRITGIVDSSNPEEAASYNGHRHAFERVKRRWWRGLDRGDAKIQRLIDRGWVLPGNKRGLQGGTTKWRYIHGLFNEEEKRRYGDRPKRKAEMLHAFDSQPNRYRVSEFYRRWDQRIGEQTEIHHLLPLDFGGTNNQTFIPLSRDKHTKNANSIHLAFWNPLKRWLVGLRGQTGPN